MELGKTSEFTNVNPMGSAKNLSQNDPIVEDEDGEISKPKARRVTLAEAADNNSNQTFWTECFDDDGNKYDFNSANARMLLNNVAQAPAIAQGFYQQFLLPLIQDVLGVMTDRLHKSGFKMHATLLQQMFHLVQLNQVTVPLSGDGQTLSNPEFLRDHMGSLLVQSFPNLTRNQVGTFVEGLFNVNLDILAFKVHLRDFLVNLKEFSVEDNTGLFTEETEETARLRSEQLNMQRSSVPGMLKPSEIADDDL